MGGEGRRGVVMRLSDEDLAVIKTCFEEKGWRGAEICRQFRGKNCDAVKRKVYEGRRERFSNLDELKKRIQRVWKDACDVETLRKAIMQFRPRLKAVVTENGGPIKTHFG